VEIAMTQTRWMLLPGFLLGSLMLVFLTGFIPQKTEDRESRKRDEPHVEEEEPCDLGRGFPKSIERWCSLVEYYANEQGLDPALIAAVMLQESGGDEQAYSSSGAVGLMQVMPRDGLAAGFYCGGNPCFSNRPAIEELLDAEFNISYGTQMLANLVAKKGSIRDALFAYGPMDMGYAYADKVLAIYDSYR
jgi:hypothetical protein